VWIGERLCALRRQRGLSQGDLENTSGLMRCYISRVEQGRTVPCLETLERFAAALGVPLYMLFYESDSPRRRPASQIAPAWRNSLMSLERRGAKLCYCCG